METGASSGCGSRTPTGRARPPRRSPRSSTGCPGSASIGTARSSTNSPARRGMPRSRASCSPRAAPITAIARRRSSGQCGRGPAPRSARCAMTAPGAPVIRLKAPQEGATTIRDLVQGEVTVENSELDDLILLRADGTPTYNLSVVVDDHDMGLTQVIRGDDHLNNAFRQTQIYRALDWPLPEFAHVPLIHGRHGAVGVEAYREMGYLPEALRNYLIRLGWSHGDDEIISTEDSIRWFDIADVGRGAARFDQAKLDSINAHYIREADDARLLGLIAERLEGALGRSLMPHEGERLARALPGLKPRAKTIVDLADKGRFYVAPRPIQPRPDAAKLLTGEARHLLGELAADLDGGEWQAGAIEQRLRDFAGVKNIKLGAVAQPLRAALTGSLASPGIFEVMEVLGRDESLARLADAAAGPT